MRTVGVELGARSYDVVIGDGAVDLLAGVVSSVVPGAARAAVVTQPGIGFEVDPGLPVEEVLVGDGEEAKSLAEVERLCRAFARSGLSRSDVVIAVGGGVVTDLAGFAAASYLRGIAYVNVATSLLAQVDAAIGGKTGVNIPEGKNLVGAFWQPRAVLCDTAALATLPPREWSSGRGEIAKYALIEEGDRSGAGSFHELATRGADHPVRRDEGSRGGRRRTRGRATDDPQLRSHPRPRPRSERVRRSGGHRAPSR